MSYCVPSSQFQKTLQTMMPPLLSPSHQPPPPTLRQIIWERWKFRNKEFVEKLVKAWRMVSDQQLKLKTMRTLKVKKQGSIETKIFSVLKIAGQGFDIGACWSAVGQLFEPETHVETGTSSTVGLQRWTKLLLAKCNALNFPSQAEKDLPFLLSSQLRHNFGEGLLDTVSQMGPMRGLFYCESGNNWEKVFSQLLGKSSAAFTNFC